MAGRSIGVVSLLADKQALRAWELLTEELGPELMERHRIACGDARTFQGKERDVMFLSMVSAPNEVGAALSRDTFAQRFNVAASRARDRMYLVRSVGLEHLSEADRLRRSLISHFSSPFVQDETRLKDLRKLCESPFEREMYDALTQRGYWVTPQVKVGHYRIDMVVEGHNDARLAVECDGDQYHGADKWADDMQRQRVLERAGWVFWRCFASAFIRRRNEMLDDLGKTLKERGIEPIGAEGAPMSVHTEHRTIDTTAIHPESSTIMESADEEDEVESSLPTTAKTAPTGTLVEVEVPVFVPPKQEDQKTEMFRPRVEASRSSGRTEWMEQVIKFCRSKNLKLVDNREKNGALWAYYPIQDGAIASRFKEWGFKFAEGKGWWTK